MTAEIGKKKNPKNTTLNQITSKGYLIKVKIGIPILRPYVPQNGCAQHECESHSILGTDLATVDWTSGSAEHQSAQPTF